MPVQPTPQQPAVDPSQTAVPATADGAAAAAAVDPAAVPVAAAAGPTGGEPWRLRPYDPLGDAAHLKAIATAESVEELAKALEAAHNWDYLPEQKAAIQRCKTYIPDDNVLAGFFVQSINEWKISQPRVLVLSTTAYYRVFYNPKNSKIDHYHKTPLSQLRVLEKTSKGLKVFLTHQDGYGGPKKWMGTIAVGIGLKKEKRNEFQFARQYLPVCRPVDAAIAALAAAFAKAAELLKRSSSQAHFVPPNIITTAERKQILADREEERRRELERIEREGATLELTRAIETAQASRGESSAACARAADMLVRPLRRAKRAVGMDQAIVCRAEGLKSELDEEKRTRERQERLERERLERESAVGALHSAVASAQLGGFGVVGARRLHHAQLADAVDVLYRRRHLRMRLLAAHAAGS